MDAKLIIVDDVIWVCESEFFARVWFDTAQQWTALSVHRIGAPDSTVDPEQVRHFTEAEATDLRALLERVIPLVEEWNRVKDADPVRLLFGTHVH